MILRSITKHVKEQNWFAVALDFLIVVVGVLLAIQVANWNESRAERALEKQYLSLLVRDLKAVDKMMASHIKNEQVFLDSANTALSIINDRSKEADPLEIGRALTMVGGRHTIRLESPTFTEIKSAGRLTLIQDPRIRDELVTHFDELARLQKLVDRNTDAFGEPYTAYLRDLGLGFVTMPADFCKDFSNTPACFAGSELSQQFDGKTLHAAEAVLKLEGNDRLRNDLRSQLVWRSAGVVGNIRSIERTRTGTQRLLDLLEAQQ